MDLWGTLGGQNWLFRKLNIAIRGQSFEDLQQQRDVRVEADCQDTNQKSLETRTISSDWERLGRCMSSKKSSF